MAKTLFEKIWSRNLVRDETLDHPSLLYVSLHLLHEITSPQAFQDIEKRGLKVRRPDLTLAIVDHCAPSQKDSEGKFIFSSPTNIRQIKAMEDYCRRHRITCISLDDDSQGIVHVVAPEMGLSRPGSVIVCGDSHTSTHGAFGAIALGIGTSEVAQVLSSQCIMLRRPKNMRIIVDGILDDAVTAKDLALHIIRKLGANSCKGYGIEYQGTGISALTMEERLTLCNMTIEAGSRFGLIAPDKVTWDYLEVRGYVPDESRDNDWFSDDNADWSRTVTIDASEITPMITWGTTPAMGLSWNKDSLPEKLSEDEKKAKDYMGWDKDFSGQPIQHVFIGSCTNGRISDLKAAAQVFKGKRIADHVSCLVVPGSQAVKQEAEALGLNKVFTEAGARWGEPGCSLCNAMNGDVIPAGDLAVSTSNRNFEGRQGPGARTLLASPETAAKIACRGTL